MARKYTMRSKEEKLSIVKDVLSGTPAQKARTVSSGRRDRGVRWHATSAARSLHTRSSFNMKTSFSSENC